MKITRLPYLQISSVPPLLIFVSISLFNLQLLAAQTGTLKLTVLDSTTNQIVPARVEIQGSDGEYYVAEDALLVGGDCDMSDHGAGLHDLETTLASFHREVGNPYTRSTQFYSNGKSSIYLPSGTAAIRVYKGPEYELHVEKVDIQAGKTTQHEIRISRWVNMPEKGWYSADDHLHIPRPSKELNPYIMKMMQAEDIHVGNLLQMGKVVNFNIAPQYSHGEESYYQEGGYILAAGQENPRTHFLGHTITLGAKTALHSPEEYLIYRLLWQEASKQGAINGYAHYGSMFSGQSGLPLVLHHNLMHFIEVLQFNRSDYEAWYEVLNLGFRVTPTAGTDYPCGSNLPGHERFYTKVDGDFTYNNWLDGVRRGKTFVTTGPILEFRVNGHDIGEEVMLEGPDSLRIEGKVIFDNQLDDLQRIELIENGQVVGSFPRTNMEGNISFSINHPMKETSWLTLRGYGNKLKQSMSVRPWHFRSFKPMSTVHSAPIYVTIKNASPFTSHSRTKVLARKWLAHLEDLETMLEEDNIEYLAQKLLDPEFDAVPKDILIKNRLALFDEIRDAKDFFIQLSE